MSKMVPFNLLISREKALETIMGTAKPIERTDQISIENVAGRVLAEDIAADRDVPPFDRAAMDGYATKAEDTYGASYENPSLLKVVGVLHAGESTDKLLGKGEAIRIATGCPIPPGADAVVMVEFTEEKGNAVSVFKSEYPGANIAKKGEDMKKDETILRDGEALTPAKVGVLAALGKKKALVYQKPHVAIVATGSEIREPGAQLAEGQIYDVNSYTLAAVLAQNGALVTQSPIVPDSFEELKSAVMRLLDSDFIVFSGGSSVGERDMLVKVVKETGRILFHGIQIKPGKPTLFGIVGGKPVLGMPGHPASCLSNAYVFLVPVIRKMARLPPRRQITVKAKMAKRLVSSTGREQVLPVKLADEKIYAIHKKSGDITGLAEADGYVVLPVNLDVIEEDEEITVTLLE